MKERYLIAQSIYKDYLILFLKKREIKYCGKTKDIIDLFGLDNLREVNYIIFDNLKIVEKKEYPNNQYDLFLSKTLIINYLMELVGREKLNGKC